MNIEVTLWWPCQSIEIGFWRLKCPKRIVTNYSYNATRAFQTSSPVLAWANQFSASSSL